MTLSDQLATFKGRKTDIKIPYCQVKRPANSNARKLGNLQSSFFPFITCKSVSLLKGHIEKCLFRNLDFSQEMSRNSSTSSEEEDEKCYKRKEVEKLLKLIFRNDFFSFSTSLSITE